MENQEGVDLKIYRIDLLPKIPETVKDFEIWKKDPHFYVKVDPNDKRYRISASFKYLNEIWDLKINIIRNINKIKENKILNPNYDNTIINFKGWAVDNENFYFDQTEILDTTVSRLFDPKNNTVLFLITREFQGNYNTAVVFFSKDFWNLNSYLAHFDSF